LVGLFVTFHSSTLFKSTETPTLAADCLPLMVWIAEAISAERLGETLRTAKGDDLRSFDLVSSRDVSQIGRKKVLAGEASGTACSPSTATL